MLGHDCVEDSVDVDGVNINGVRRAVTEFSSRHGVEAFILENTFFMFVMMKPFE